MKYFFLLSGDYIDLANEEILSLFNSEDYELVDRLFIVNLKNDEEPLKKIGKRLALTKNIYKFLFECKTYRLIETMKNFDWNSVYKYHFCLRIHSLDKDNKRVNNQKSKMASGSKQVDEREGELFASTQTRVQAKLSHATRSKPFVIPPEKELAKYIWHSVKNPKVDLENPKTKIELFFVEDKVYCGLLIYENEEEFESRKSHLRPFPHPSSLHPKLARALINISGIKDNEILFDPFCGTGGFLIEAALMEMKIIGYDINKKMVGGCKKNLEYFKIKNFKIKIQNALKIDGKFDYVVTDLPYGLNSNVILKYKKDWKKYRINLKIQEKDFIENLESFYLKFLKQLKKVLKKKAVIIFPSYVDYKKLLKQARFKREKEFSIYVHRSLTRKIVKIS